MFVKRQNLIQNQGNEAFLVYFLVLCSFCFQFKLDFKETIRLKQYVIQQRYVQLDRKDMNESFP